MAFPNNNKNLVQNAFIDFIAHGRSYTHEQIERLHDQGSSSTRSCYIDMIGPCLEVWDPDHPFLKIFIHNPNSGITRATRDFMKGEFYAMPGNRHYTTRKVVRRVAEICGRHDICRMIDGNSLV